MNHSHQTDFIPMFCPCIGTAEKKLICKVLDTKSLSRGKFVQEFEEMFADITHKKYAISTNSGTAGLHLCVRALGLKSKDKVITSDYSFVASVNCLLYENIKPILCDIQEDFLMNIDEIESHIDPDVQAILPVDIFSCPFDVSKLTKYNLPIITDSCESFGNPIQPGSLANVFGFFPNKQITTGEGGMVVTDDESLTEKIKSLRNQGRVTADNYLEKVQLGYNYRMSDLNAAIGIAQLQKWKEICEKRKYIVELYKQQLSDVQEIRLPYLQKNMNSFFNYPTLMSNAQLRNWLISYLNENNIECGVGFPPLHYFAYIQKAIEGQILNFPVAEDLYQKTLVLPFWTEMNKTHIQRICTTLKQGIWKWKK